ncbi:MAG: hypothetical protein AB7E80_14800 [Hyphomicrobiaceae bacterium]
MRAFVTSIVALVVITAIAAIALNMVPMSARDTYTETQSVRL